ncbi:MAG: (2Fe-2S)-binding protein [Bacillota bacterium]|nr:(2Fe-2S)-binding protein [Bacillota bacterium]
MAIVECFERIPCDPCAAACKQGAIRPFADICDLPRIDHELCNGCALCVVRCPGLAIFVVDASAGDGSAVVKMPYEHTPLPRAGQTVRATDRSGRDVCAGTVTRAQRPSAFDHTALVSIRVPVEHAMDVRGLLLPPGAGLGAGAKEGAQEGAEGGAGAGGKADARAGLGAGVGPVVVCRCEEITEDDIVAAYEAGYRTPEEIKRKLRCGMGPCQGRTCMPVVLSILSRLSGRPVGDMAPPTGRPPLKPTPLASFAALKYGPARPSSVEEDGR